MTIAILCRVMRQGDKYGSALKELLQYYNIAENDLSTITDNMALAWLKERNENCNDSRNNKQDSGVCNRHKKK